MAAGQSRRFGKNKLLALLDGKPVLAYMLDALPRKRFSRLAVVVSALETAALCREHEVEPLLYGGGPVSETIRVGLGAMEGMDGCLFAAGDQPLCGGKSIARMLDVFLPDPASVVRLSWQGVPGSPVLFPKAFFPRLTALTGEKGGTATLREYDTVRLVEADSAWELWDADTPEALLKLEKCVKEAAHGIHVYR